MNFQNWNLTTFLIQGEGDMMVTEGDIIFFLPQLSNGHSL